VNLNTRWLDEREARIWRAFRDLSTGLNSAMDRQLEQETTLSGAEYAVLATLSDAALRSDGTQDNGAQDNADAGGDPVLRARDLAVELGWERSRLSHLLKRMENRGLVERRSCESDARGLDIAMTEAGRKAIEEAAPGHVDFVRENFFDQLTAAEQDAVFTASVKIQASLRAAGLWEKQAC
jgi:DNA-binding MarR family transcriptional regulator